MKVLVAEDEPVSRRRLETFLTKCGYTVVTAVDGAEALAILREPDSPRLVILDRMMPQVDGLDVCRAIRRGPSEPYVYVVLVTGQGHQQEVIEGFEAGADDYMTKPFENEELKARVRTGARIVELQEELIAAREQLRNEAMHDPLTGLLNRAAFFNVLQKEVLRAARRRSPLALIMADLDYFKDINDKHGHIAGDVVLHEAANRLRASLRASDVIGRYGGEEFIVAAPECTVNDAVSLAERFRMNMCASPIAVPHGEIFVTLSLGVAGTHDMLESGRLLRAADQALYRAKQMGRNRVEIESYV